MSVNTDFKWLWETEAQVDAGELVIRVLCRDKVPPQEHLLDLQPLVGNLALWHVIEVDPGHPASAPFQASFMTFSFDSSTNQDSYILQDIMGIRRIVTLNSPLRRRLLVWRANGCLDMLVFWNLYQGKILRIQYGGNVIVPALALMARGSASSKSTDAVTHAFERGRLPDEELR